jgi:DNA-binding SARP family transcriptional activator
MAVTCSIELLGRFAVSIDGRRVSPDAWRSRRAADLIKLLALTPSHRLPREQVMEALWPDLGPQAAGANLRKAVHYARRALASKDVLAVESRVLALVAEVNVDTVEFERDADAALAAANRSMAASVADRYAGDLLPDDPYEPWLTEPRERLRRKYLQLLRTCERWERVVELEPADEPAHRALIRDHLEQGRRTAAIRQFERLRESLRDELGLAPDPETVALYEQVLGVDGPETPTAAERARALLAWALVHRNRMELDQAERHARQAQALALEAGLGHELGEASTLLAFIAFARGTWQQTFRDEFVRAIHQDATLAMPVFDAHLCFAEFYMYGPDGHEGAERYARDLLEMAIPAGFTAGEGLARLLLGEIFMVVGRVDEAKEELGRAADLYRSCACLSGQSIALERLAEAEVLRGRRDQALRLVTRAHPLARDSGIPGHLIVRVYGVQVTACADAAAAVRVVHEAERSLERLHVCEPCSMGYRVQAAIAAARAGNLELARMQLEVADRIAGMWQGGPWASATWEARGELRLAEGDHAKAAALLNEAADGFARSGRPLDERRCRALAAGVA